MGFCCIFICTKPERKSKRNNSCNVQRKNAWLRCHQLYSRLLRDKDPRGLGSMYYTANASLSSTLKLFFHSFFFLSLNAYNNTAFLYVYTLLAHDFLFILSLSHAYFIFLTERESAKPVALCISRIGSLLLGSCSLFTCMKKNKTKQNHLYFSFERYKVKLTLWNQRF